ncbi:MULTISPECIES: hypothetical protein [unclassified Streptomyces]|uniref:hypothetical protein n=1 Tax=unclassified Streptomyces TaxID=2593676 RepID=UPI00202584F6|nr:MULTISPECIES: hypothetical protein [unclassified Streptomyces]MCX4550457.1 hypothetical protein [Streptomyces sp. NBC_01500]
MKRPAAPGTAHAGFRGLLGLLVAVVALLCAFGHTERGGRVAERATTSATSPAAASPAAASSAVPSAVSSAGTALHHVRNASVHATEADGSTPACGKKMLPDPRAQRAENHRHADNCAARPTGPTPVTPERTPRPATSPIGPAPPPPPALLSVLRI